MVNTSIRKILNSISRTRYLTMEIKYNSGPKKAAEAQKLKNHFDHMEKLDPFFKKQS